MQKFIVALVVVVPLVLLLCAVVAWVRFVKRHELEIWLPLRVDRDFTCDDVSRVWHGPASYIFWPHLGILKILGYLQTSPKYHDEIFYRLTEKGVEYQKNLIKKHMDKLLKDWRAWAENSEVAYSSFMEDFLQHPSHEEVLKIGELAIPALLAELQKQDAGGLTCLAILPTLTQITKMAPSVEIKHGFARMNIPSMIKWWLDWGRQRGIEF